MANGLFGGIDTRSQAEILQTQAQDQAREFEQLIPRNAPLSYQSMFRTGGMLSRFLKNRFGGGDQLPDSQRVQVDSVAAAKNRLGEWSAANPDGTIEDKGLQWTKYLSEELLSRGDPQGANLAASYAQQQQLREKGKIELELLEGRRDDEAVERENWRVLNTLKPIFLRGEAWDAQPRVAFIAPDGSAEYKDEQGKDVVVPRGQYTWNAAARPNQERGSGNLRDLIAPSQRLQLITQNAALGRQVDSYMNMWNSLKENVTDTGSVDFMSKSGAIQGWFTDWSNTLSSISRAAGSVFGVEGEPDLSRLSNAQAYIAERPEVVEDLKPYMPTAVAANADRAARWASAATQLAYSRGTALEPAQRNMSDQDFRVHIQSVGASTSSPETFRQIAMANMLSDIDNYQTVMSGYYPAEQARIIDPTAIKRVDDKLALFMETFTPTFGEASTPGPGLQPTNTVIEVDF